jgi:hypothetical protein
MNTTTRLLPLSATTSSSKAEHVTPKESAIVHLVGDCDVMVPGHEAQSIRGVQQTVAAASSS